MFMGISDCDNYTMEMSNPERANIYILYQVTFRGTGHRPNRTVMYNTVHFLAMLQMVIPRTCGGCVPIRPICFCRMDRLDVVIWQR